jgi:hypothetical protein
MPATTRAITLGRYSGRKMRGSIDGTEAQPGFFYADDDDTGIFSPSDGKISLTLDGVTTTTWEDGLTTFVGDIAIDDSIIHIGDTDTKIRFPATDTFTIETAGVEALRVDSSQDTTLAGTLFGPATFTIEPVGGEVSGTVKIQGDLTVEGTTTTINSTELTIDDINITIADGAADAAAADGAGITIDGADAALTYQATPNSWEFDRTVTVDNQGELRLKEPDSTGNDRYVSLKAPAALAASVNLTLPVDDGDADQALVTDGGGTLSWSDVSSTVANGCIYENYTTISDDYTITTDYNAMSAGPITLSAVLTIPTGSVYTIV